MNRVKVGVRNLSRGQRVVGGVVVGMFLAVVVVAGGTLIPRIGKVGVEVGVAPFDAAVYLNGVRVANGEVNYILPGNYEMRVEREHFEVLKGTVEVGEDRRYVVGKMVASDEEGERVMEERRGDYLVVEGVMGQMAVEEGAALIDKWPILRFLPVNNRFYSISYRYVEGVPLVRVWAVDDYMMGIARRKMERWGVDLGGVEIEYLVGVRG